MPKIHASQAAKEVDAALEQATDQASDKLHELSDAAADKLHQAADQASNKLGALSDGASAALNKASGLVDDLTRRALDQARKTSGQVRQQLGRAGDATVGYIKDEPYKSVLMAAATGAAAAYILTRLARSRSQR